MTDRSAPSAADTPPRPAGEASRIVTRPWFWATLIGIAFLMPIVKALRAELPPPPPFLSEPLELVLRDERGAPFELADLRGRLVIASEIPLANDAAAHDAVDALVGLQKRLKGVAEVVAYLILAHGTEPAELGAILDARTLRKPGNVPAWDEGRAAATRLLEAAGSRTAAFVLLDRHGRVRGAFASEDQDLDELVRRTGLLANWAAADPGEAP